jgi:hypothetical protein
MIPMDHGSPTETAVRLKTVLSLSHKEVSHTHPLSPYIYMYVCIMCSITVCVQAIATLYLSLGNDMLKFLIA